MKFDQMDDESLSKNSNTSVIVGFIAISKNRNAIGMKRKLFKKKGT